MASPWPGCANHGGSGNQGQNGLGKRGVQRQHLETDCHDFVKFCEVAVGSMIFFLLLYPLFQVTLYLSMFRSTMFLSCLGYSLSEIGK